MDNNENKSSLERIMNFIKKYKFALSISLPSLLFLVSIFATIFLIVVIVVSPTTLTGDVSDFFEEMEHEVAVFTEKMGNLFTLQGFHTDEEVANNRQYEFYKELEVIKEKYQEKYDVSINTPLIVATLTYNRTLGDYTEDATTEDLEMDSTENGNNYLDKKMTAQEVADFYKAAKGHVKTLAEYMLLATHTKAECSDTESGIYPKYKNFEELAEDHEVQWATIGTVSLDFGFKVSTYLGYNLQTIQIYEPYNTRDTAKFVIETDDPNNPLIIPSCNFNNATKEMEDAFDYELNKINSKLQNNEDVVNYLNCKLKLDGLLQIYPPSPIILEEIEELNKTCPELEVKAKEYADMLIETEVDTHQFVTNGYFTYDFNDVNYTLKRGAFSCTGVFSDKTKVASEEDAKGLVKFDGCAVAAKESLLYSVNYFYNEDDPSLYQANLKTPMNSIFNELLSFMPKNDRSFIEQYYEEWVYNEDGSKAEGAVDDIIKGIYELYELTAGNLSISMADGEWNNWKQKDPIWGSIRLGNSSATIRSAGCLMTSYAIQIMNSGTQITIPDFNPGTFVQSLGLTAFSSDGSFARGDGVGMFAPAAPNFTCARLENKPSSVLADLLKEGKWPIVQVYNPSMTGRTHFVAIIGIENGRPIMADPATNKTDLFATYPEIASTIEHVKYCWDEGR